MIAMVSIQYSGSMESGTNVETESYQIQLDSNFKKSLLELFFWLTVHSKLRESTSCLSQPVTSS